MTTSGIYSFSVNRDQIIRIAMMNIGKLDEIETPSAQDITDCNLVLNMLVKQSSCWLPAFASMLMRVIALSQGPWRRKRVRSRRLASARR